MAGWALGLALIPSIITWIISVVFACTVISRSKDGRDHGRTMAISALVIVGLWVVLAIAVIAIVLATDSERDDDGNVTAAGSETIVDLRVGDCLPDVQESGEHYTTKVVPCHEAHRAEVFGTFDLEGEWTDQKEIDRLSDAGCLDRYAAYVGVPPRKSSLGLLVYRPVSARSFRADPGVVCIVVADKPVDTPLKDSRL